MEQDKNKNYDQMGSSIRLRVRLDISKPLRIGFMVNTEESSESCWVTIRYERIPEFCFLYGKIGHVVKECAERKVGEE